MTRNGNQVRVLDPTPAPRNGLRTVVLAGLVRAVDLQPGDGERALAAMRAAGARIEQPA
jgi:hypothetical protein